MSDDLVTRLREQREDELMLGNDWLVDVLGGAADEIERLQAENDGLQIRIYTLSKKLKNEVRDE